MSGLLPRLAPATGSGAAGVFNTLSVGSLIVSGVAAFNAETVRTLAVSTSLTDTALTANTILATDSGKTFVSLPLTNGQVLVGSAGAAPVAATISGPGNVSVAIGPGTISVDTIANPVFTGLLADEVIYTDAGGALQGVALTNGQVLVGSTGVAPVSAAITGPGNVAVTLGAGTIAVDTVASPTFTGNQVGIATPQTPATSSSVGVKGTICWDSGFIYVCTNTNTWVRVATATW